VVLSDVLPAVLADAEVLYESPEVTGRVVGERYAWEIADLAPGASGEIRLRATVAPEAEAGTLTNEAQIRGAEPEAAPSDNVASVTNEILREIDLHVVKAVEPASALHPGDVVTYTLSFGNAGPDVATGVVLSDVLPAVLVDAEVLYESPEVAGLVAGERYAWEIVNLAPGASGEIRLRATVAPEAEAGTLTNEAKIRGVEPDADTADNQAAASNEIVLLVSEIDLWITKTVEPAGALHPGDLVTYTLSFGNDGPDVATGVVLSDVLPAVLVDAEVLSESALVTSRVAGERYVWEIADLEPGAEGEIRLRATVGRESEAGSVTNEAEIHGVEPERAPSDNRASVSSEIAPLFYYYFPYMPVAPVGYEPWPPMYAFREHGPH
jgi:uncharacterized repeat protein (TIGR01451 family)